MDVAPVGHHPLVAWGSCLRPSLIRFRPAEERPRSLQRLCANNFPLKASLAGLCGASLAAASFRSRHLSGRRSRRPFLQRRARPPARIHTYDFWDSRTVERLRAPTPAAVRVEDASADEAAALASEAILASLQLSPRDVGRLRRVPQTLADGRYNPAWLAQRRWRLTASKFYHVANSPSSSLKEKTAEKTLEKDGWWFRGSRHETLNSMYEEKALQTYQRKIWEYRRHATAFASARAPTSPSQTSSSSGALAPVAAGVEVGAGRRPEPYGPRSDPGVPKVGPSRRHTEYVTVKRGGRHGLVRPKRSGVVRPRLQSLVLPPSDAAPMPREEAEAPAAATDSATDEPVRSVSLSLSNLAAEAASKETKSVRTEAIGMLTCPEMPWLAASPDGIVTGGTGGLPLGLLEVKSYQACLDVGSPVWTQVQGSMAVASKCFGAPIHWCDVVMPTSKKRVKFDCVRWAAMEQKLERFFFEILLPLAGQQLVADGWWPSICSSGSTLRFVKREVTETSAQ